MPVSESNILFISHNAADRPFALALHAALNELTAGAPPIDVRYSSSAEAGPQGGERWREWIHSQVVEARSALILVTPHALGKPWLLWEAGACVGAALAQRTASSRKRSESHTRLIVSIAYGLTEPECPDPLRGDQIVAGMNADRMAGVFENIMHAHGLTSHQLIKAGRCMKEVIDRYLSTVSGALLAAPSLVTEANVQDWLLRLESIVSSDRLSELHGFERWLTLAFGRDGEAAAIPIDVRLHRRLGEIYLGQKDYLRASHQFRLARRAAPRDIYILRPLAEVRLKLLVAGTADNSPDAREEIESLLQAISALDAQAFVSVPDAAALLAKYQWRVLKEMPRAIDVLRTALEATPDSYYLADLLAQAYLESGNRAVALSMYRDALRIVDRLDEKNVWSCATAATAALALGDVDASRRWLATMNSVGPPNQSELDAVHRGLEAVAGSLGIAHDEVESLVASGSQRNLVSQDRVKT
jgi:tetratricopeptide (TPR) repeat protein